VALTNQCVQYPCLISSCDLFKYDKNEKNGDSKWISQKLDGFKAFCLFCHNQCFDYTRFMQCCNYQW